MASISSNDFSRVDECDRHADGRTDGRTSVAVADTVRVLSDAA